MSNGKTPIVQTYYDFTDVKHRTVNSRLSYSDEVFTYLKSMRYAKGMELISLDKLEQLINKYSNAEGGKLKDRCLLKGLYKDGFDGVNCYKNVPYLFFDIDIKNTKKEKQNLHLLQPKTNQKIFEELKKVSVICWRSNSGTGIAGVLYVPQLANCLEKDKVLHLEAGKQITKYLSDHLHNATGIQRIIFDNTQSKFRQLRFLAQQEETRSLNYKPFEFTYNVDVKEKTYSKGVKRYAPANYKSPYGTLTNQFDADNDILTIAQICGFTVVSSSGNKTRVKHPFTTSSTSGVIDEAQNVYFNHSGSFSEQKAFSPSQLLYYCEFKDNWSKFFEYLNGLGYKEKQITKEAVNTASKTLKEELKQIKDEDKASEIIFKHCYDLQTLSHEDKQVFIKENCPSDNLKKFFIAYLKLVDYRISYDKSLTIETYVSEKLPEILAYTDEHNKVIARAETGKGKTTAFIRDFHTHRPNERLLILVPLTIILEQNRNEYGNKAIYLDGLSDDFEHEDAKTANLVLATYDQGVKVLEWSKFDYIVIDEIHQLITANDWRKVINELTPHLDKNKVIGLTGTPNAIFKAIGYKLINIDVAKPKKTKAEIRFSNCKPYDLALSHLKQVKGKTLVRLNDTNGIEILKTQLVAVKLYKKNEILVLHSTKEIKASNDFKQLAHDRIFNDKIKVVLTTSLIDEGLSIDQTEFTDIVFIETDYSPRPEAIKQFFARFRNEDPNRKNYLYLRTKNNQSPTNYNPFFGFKETLRDLENEALQYSGFSMETTYSNVFSNEDFFYNDNTVNLYYLAYSITQNLFRFFNIHQFISFLESNYNLKFTINEDFEPNFKDGSIEKYSRNEIKTSIGQAWYYNKNEVLQSLGLHTLNNPIRKAINVDNSIISPQIETLVIQRIKDFEKLYKRNETLKDLGEADPNRILLDSTDGMKLNSDKNYKDELTLLQLNKMIFEPKNKADKNTVLRVVEFSEWVKNQSEFTTNQMNKKMRELRIYKNDSYSFENVKRVLEWFEVRVKKDYNTGLIKVI
jgi:hypothetical protein